MHSFPFPNKKDLIQLFQLIRYSFEMLHSYCARTEIIEPPISPDAVGLLTAMAILAEPIDSRAEDGSAGFTSMFSEFDEDVCNDGVESSDQQREVSLY